MIFKLICIFYEFKNLTNDILTLAIESLLKNPSERESGDYFQKWKNCKLFTDRPASPAALRPLFSFHSFTLRWNFFHCWFHFKCQVVVGQDGAVNDASSSVDRQQNTKQDQERSTF